MTFREDHDLHKRRYSRNMGLLAVLLAFVAIVFGLTIVKVSQGEPIGGPGPAGVAAPATGGNG